MHGIWGGKGEAWWNYSNGMLFLWDNKNSVELDQGGGYTIEYVWLKNTELYTFKKQKKYFKVLKK